MTTQTDPFYPRIPSYKAKATETSKQAAKAMRSRAATLRDQCEARLAFWQMTADEIATDLGESPLAIRPRISELVAMGRVEATTMRRPNVSGKSAVVWRVKA